MAYLGLNFLPDTPKIFIEDFGQNIFETVTILGTFVNVANNLTAVGNFISSVLLSSNSLILEDIHIVSDMYAIFQTAANTSIEISLENSAKPAFRYCILAGYSNSLINVSNVTSANDNTLLEQYLQNIRNFYTIKGVPTRFLGDQAGMRDDYIPLSIPINLSTYPLYSNLYISFGIRPASINTWTVFNSILSRNIVNAAGYTFISGYINLTIKLRYRRTQ